MSGIVPGGTTRGDRCLPLIAAVCLAAATVAMPQPDGGYRLAADDVIGITVLEQPQLSASAVRVAPDGTIAVPIVGRLQVVGMTLPELEAAVTAGLRQRLVNPQVTITLQAKRTSYVFILGAVPRAGSYPLGDGWGVAQLVASAGGLAGEVTAMSATLLRATGERVELDLPQAMLAGPTRPEFALRPGDVLDIRKRTILITVAGAVWREGRYEVPAEANLVAAISAAGGMTSSATLRRITVERATGEREQYDLAPALLRGEPIPPVVLQTGDTIVVPTEVTTVAALGDVVKPGTFPFDYDVGLRVSELIALAGGLRAGLAQSQAKLFRRDGTVLPLDLVAILQAGDKTADLALQPNDALSVTVQKITVQVSGQVSRPGQYDMAPGSGVLTALTLAGGLKDDAALGRVTVRHADGSVVRVDLFNAIATGDLAGDLTMADGDLIMVPQSKTEVAVIGAVTSPGYYEFDEHRGATVAQVLADAGGPTEHAAITNIGVLRNTADGPIRIEVDLNAVLRDGELDRNIPLQDRDVVFVPEDKGTDWNAILRAITTITVVGRWLLE